MPDRTNIKKEEFISTREASKILDVSLRTVQLWVESGILKAWKTAGGHRRISQSSVDQILLQRRQAISSGSEQDQKAFHILLVEDDSALRNLFYYFFSSWKFPIRVDIAKDGFEGLINLGREIPDLLVTDLNMPGMNGFDMLRHLKRAKEFDGLNIIVLTALNDDYIKDVGGLPEGVQVFHKPVALSRLEPVIEALIANAAESHYAQVNSPA